MPIYEYRCDNGHNFEVMQRMSDEPIHVCEVCGAPVQRVFHPVAVHFKGSGFYSTDYGKGRGGGGGSESKDSKGERFVLGLQAGHEEGAGQGGVGQQQFLERLRRRRLEELGFLGLAPARVHLLRRRSTDPTLHRRARPR